MFVNKKRFSKFINDFCTINIRCINLFCIDLPTKCKNELERDILEL